MIPEAPEVPQIKEEQKIPETENPTVKADEQNNGEMKKPVKPEQQPSQKPKTVHDGRKPLEISGKQLSKVSKRAKARRKLKARKKK